MSIHVTKTEGKSGTRVVGVTGGIGSGKSAVAEAFGALGIGWVDADHVAREVVMPGEPALVAIAQRYGPTILDANGTLDRRALRARIFDDENERQWLERETHPRIRQRLLTHLERLRDTGAPYCLLVSPLLIESGQHQLVDRILVVDAPRDIQIQRTLARDGVDQRQVESILAAQSPRERRLAAADDVIDNGGDRHNLQEQVARLDARYRQLFAQAIQ
ncbi:dephospho-CoA kinase [Salinicola socius]|uniref:Dephospho-CoA kinase n=1 Tax=Salinicola socius TaxID=404433 RepID=A0A1Q8SQQ1_9GAMM|nr:dephospho-CoA kinase [Salinicola socius]OLO03759.1 dephospho-CoA kinase [Salinicola socius]